MKNETLSTHSWERVKMKVKEFKIGLKSLPTGLIEKSLSIPGVNMYHSLKFVIWDIPSIIKLSFPDERTMQGSQTQAPKGLLDGPVSTTQMWKKPDFCFGSLSWFHVWTGIQINLWIMAPKCSTRNELQISLNLDKKIKLCFGYQLELLVS